MVFDGKEALSESHGMIVDEIKEMIVKYPELSSKPRAFEHWIQKNTMKGWIESRGYDLVWPTEVDFPIGQEGNELGIDIGMIVKEEPGGDSEPIHRALICQCYFPNEENFNEPPEFKAKAESVAGSISALTQEGGNEKRQAFIQELINHSILYEDEDGSNKINKELVDGFYAVFGLWPTKENGEYKNASKTVKALSDEGLIVFDAQVLCENKWIEENPSGFGRPEERDLVMTGVIEEPVDGVTTGLVSAKNLHLFFKEDREESPWVGSKNQSLLDSNLRFKIEGATKSSSSIAKGMKDTLKTEPANFMKYNNGIVIVADDSNLRTEARCANEECGEIVEASEEKCSTCETVITEDNPTVKTIKLSKPSIVNGGQTTNAVYDVIEAANKAGENPPEGHVQVKIVKTEDETMSKSIARYANKQNTIDDRDQHATDEDQIEYYDLLISGRYIFWDYKRGLYEAKLSKDEHNQLNSGGGKKAIRTLHNEKVLQRTAAIIGMQDRSFGYKKELWADEKIIQFVFAKDRTKELQIAIGRESVIATDEAGNKQAKRIPLIRNGREEFCKDMILAQAISKMRETVTKKRGDKLAHVNKLPDGQFSESDKQAFASQTIFHSHWEYALQRAFFRVLDKHTKGEDDDAKLESRNRVRNALLGGDFWKDNTITNNIYQSTKKWNSWCNIDTNTNTDNNIISEGDFCEEFQLMGLWMKGLQDIFMDIPVSSRSKRSSFTGRNVYALFETKLNETLGNSDKLGRIFPTVMPVKDEEFQNEIKAIEHTFGKAIEWKNYDQAEALIGKLKEIIPSTPAQIEQHQLLIDLAEDTLKKNKSA